MLEYLHYDRVSTITEYSLSEPTILKEKIVSVETISIQKPSTSTVPRNAPRYRVLLHNDDFNSMEYVVETLIQTIAGMTPPQAVNIMMEAHTNGMAMVIACALEHAEFYCQTLLDRGLTSTIEPED